MAELNRTSPLPLYAQLARQLEARITSAVYQPGATIPSEHALSEEFKIGRPTVRQATEELIKKGLVERRRGAGTFVLKPTPAVDLFSLRGTIRSFEHQGLKLDTRALGPPKQEMSVDGRTGLRFERLGHLDDVPVVYERFWFDAAVFPQLDRHLRRNSSLSDVVETRYGLAPLSADQSLRAVKFTLQQARLFHLQRGAVGLFVERSLHFSVARDAVTVSMLCRQDQRYTFCQTIGGSLG
jgi:GntR family transcriptional regulator